MDLHRRTHDGAAPTERKTSVTTDPQVDAEGRLVVLRREWPDPIDDVWSALTESERTARWIGTWTGRGEAAGRTATTVEFTMTGEVDLDQLDDPDRSIWRSALRAGFTPPGGHQPAPDRFLYRVHLEQTGLDVTVGDHELPDDLRTLLDRVVLPPT